MWRDVSPLGSKPQLRRLGTFVEAFAAGETIPPGDRRQRSAPGRFFPDLEANPWHVPEEVPGAKELCRNYAAIHRDYLSIAKRHARFVSYEDAEGHVSGGDGPARSGRPDDVDVFLTHVPDLNLHDRHQLCPGVERALTGAWFADSAMFSRLTERNFVGLHSDFINYVLTLHLGLRVPEGAGIRVGGETSWWTEGECIAFDASFLHEVWNDGPGERIVLIVNTWHPGLTPVEVAALKVIVPRIRAWEKSRRSVRDPQSR